MLMNWSKKMYCGFAPLYFQCQKYRNTCACHWRVCFPLGNPNARCPFMERMTTRALSLGVETRVTEATWQTIRNASKLAKDHKNPLHESWCIYHRGTSTYHHIHQVPQPTVVPPRKRPERPQFFNFQTSGKNRVNRQVSKKMRHQNESMVPKCDANHVIESSCSHCLVVLLLSETSCGEQCCQVQRDKQFKPLWRWFLPGVPFLKWYYPNMNPLQHESTVVTLLHNPSQECFWKWPKPTVKFNKNKQNKKQLYTCHDLVWS